MADAPQRTVARDLVLDEFREVDVDASLHAAMDVLVEMHAGGARAKALIVVHLSIADGGPSDVDSAA